MVRHANLYIYYRKIQRTPGKKVVKTNFCTVIVVINCVGILCLEVSLEIFNITSDAYAYYATCSCLSRT